VEAADLHLQATGMMTAVMETTGMTIIQGEVIQAVPVPGAEKIPVEDQGEIQA